MSIKDVFLNDNKINESNIIMFVATLMFVIIDIVALFSTEISKELAIFFCFLVLEHLVFIFFMNKTENSKLDAKDVLNSVENIAKTSLSK